MKSKLNKQEKKAMTQSAKLWNTLFKFKHLHLTDEPAFYNHIIGIQKLIMARPEQRAFNANNKKRRKRGN